MSSTMKNILGVLLSIVLCFVIFMEFRTGFILLKNHQLKATTQLIDLATTKGKAAITIDEVTVYEEMPSVAEKGDVIEIKKHKIKVKINGALTDSSMQDYGEYTYSSIDTEQPMSFIVDHKTSNYSEFKNAVNEYWRGNTEEILKICGIDSTSVTPTFYQNSFIDGDVPVVFVNSDNKYYMFVECEDDSYAILSATEPFSLSNEKTTAHFSDPSENPMLNHNYSGYETLAAENTIREMLSGEKDDDAVSDNPYDSYGVLGSSETYTSKTDEEIRKQMVSLANYEFKPDGTSSETSAKIDLTSEAAKNSKWELSSTEFTYEAKGLKLSMLAATRSRDVFSVEGNINNLLNVERPFVMVIKYLDSNNALLGISVVDRRETPINSSGVSNFGATITPTQNKIDIQKIASIMFEVH